MAYIKKIKLPNEQDARIIRDADSMHFLGHTTTDIVPYDATSGTPTGASITVDGTSVTAVVNDYVTSGTGNLNYIAVSYTPSGETTPVIGWRLLSEVGASIPVQDVTVNGTSVLDSSDHTAKVVVKANTVAYDGTTDANNVFADGIKAVTQNANDNSQKLATTAYVDNAVTGIGQPMVYHGGATLTADSTTTTTAAIAVTDPASATNIKKGFTYKIISIAQSPVYTGTLRVGDTLIAAKDSPKVTADWVVDTDWNIIPTADDIDVTSIGATGGLKTNKTNNAAITDSGTLELDLTGNTPLADTASAPTTTANSGRVFAVALDGAGHPAVNVTPGDLADTVSDVTTGNAVSALEATTTASQTSANNLNVFSVGTGDDSETLILKYLVQTTTDKNVVSTAT